MRVFLFDENLNCEEDIDNAQIDLESSDRIDNQNKLWIYMNVPLILVNHN